MNDRPLLPVIAGATASGKTACAVELCRIINGEIVSADSMQIFRGMEILSAAPTIDELDGIACHLTGIADPTEPFSAAAYHDIAMECISSVIASGKQPVLCGGTGLYIDAATRAMDFSEKGDEAIREKLHTIADEPDGRTKLHQMLAAIDPESAQRLHPNDVRRMIRAIEIYELTGMTLTEKNRRAKLNNGVFNEKIFALDRPRDELYARIDTRVDEMIAGGLFDEVHKLMACEEEHPTAIQAIGYKEIAAALKGDIPMEYAIEKMKQASRNYAKRQITWLKRDERVVWINASMRTPADIANEIAKMLEENSNEFEN